MDNETRALLLHLEVLAKVRNREYERKPRTITLTDDQALLILAVVNREEIING